VRLWTACSRPSRHLRETNNQDCGGCPVTRPRSRTALKNRFEIALSTAPACLLKEFAINVIGQIIGTVCAHRSEQCQKSMSAVLALSLIGIVSVVGGCGSTKDLSGGNDAVTRFHSQFDAQDFATIYVQADQRFRDGISQLKFIDFMKCYAHLVGQGYGHVPAGVYCDLQHFWHAGATNVSDQVRRRQWRRGVCLGQEW
jgi:hypothetical protein